MIVMKASLLSLVFCLPIAATAASPSASEFFNTLYSQAYFLEQCLARKQISNTNVHNQNIKKSNALGYSPDDFWKAGENGANGLIFDMIKRTWVRVPIDPKNCEFVRREQDKFYKTLTRY